MRYWPVLPLILTIACDVFVRANSDYCISDTQCAKGTCDLTLNLCKPSSGLLNLKLTQMSAADATVSMFPTSATALMALQPSPNLPYELIAGPATDNVASFSIYSGNGDMTFQAPKSFASGLQPADKSSLLAANLDGDKYSDLVVYSTSSSGKIVSCLGQDKGVISCKPPLSIIPIIATAIAAPLSSNFYSDIMFIDKNHKLYSYPNLGQGSFFIPKQITTTNQPVALAAGSFQGKTNWDYALIFNNSPTVEIDLNLGNGMFSPPNAYPLGVPGSLIAGGDFNGDHRPDLIIIGQAGPAQVAVGQGDGSFQIGTANMVTGPLSQVLVTDLNADGRFDLVTYAAPASSFNVYLSQPSGSDVTFGAAIQFSYANPLPIAAFAAAPFSSNNNGKNDLVLLVSNLGSGTLIFYRNDSY